MTKRISKNRFIKKHLKGSRMSLSLFEKIQKVVPCNCTLDDCDGWRVVGIDWEDNAQVEK